MNGMAYVMVVLGILIAKGLGFFRDIIFASAFGATTETDMYFQIFGLVNLIFTGIGVALSTLVIKQLNKTENDTEEKKKAYVSCFITKSSLIIALVTVFLYIFSKPCVRVLLPGLEAADFEKAVRLMYIMLPSFLFVVVAYIISGVLQNLRIFFITSVMSLPFNCIIIASLFLPDVNIFTVGIVTTIGWFLHIAVLLPSFYKKGYRLLSLKGLKAKTGGNNREILYIFISNMMFQLCFMIDKAFVSGEQGAASTINYASNLFITISSVFVVAMSNVVFPSISKNYEEKNIDYVRSLLKYIMTVMFAIFVPFILTVSCFGTNIIALLYERGEFTPDLTYTTAILFAVYTLGAFGYLCQELFNKILYLGSKYSYTVIGTILVVGIKPFINKLMLPYGEVAIAISTTVLFSLYAITIFAAITKVTGSYLDRELGKNMIKILLAGIAAFVIFILFKAFSPNLLDGKFTFIIPLLLCAIAYCGVLVLSGLAKTILQGRKSETE